MRARTHGLGSINFEAWLKMLVVFRKKKEDERHKARIVELNVL